ncbi:MAG: flagellar hook-basal body complex protein [Eubacteriales bacterium]|nr:flagellar hook-basal body complex protein [Eubacteriales bacterium]
MMRALFSGVTGLRSHQTRMDVIGNNIANVNTTGYKKASVTFADLYSETVSAAAAASGTGNSATGGVNAKQIGLGSTVSSITKVHTPGSAQYTGRPMDVAISGDGYFAVQTPTGIQYTRSGNFSTDTLGNLVTEGSGYYVQCVTPNHTAEQTYLFESVDVSDLVVAGTKIDEPAGTIHSGTPTANMKNIVGHEFGFRYAPSLENGGYTSSTSINYAANMTTDPTSTSPGAITACDGALNMGAVAKSLLKTYSATPPTNGPNNYDVTFSSSAGEILMVADGRTVGKAATVDTTLNGTTGNTDYKMTFVDAENEALGYITISYYGDTSDTTLYSNTPIAPQVTPPTIDDLVNRMKDATTGLKSIPPIQIEENGTWQLWDNTANGGNGALVEDNVILTTTNQGLGTVINAGDFTLATQNYGTFRLNLSGGVASDQELANELRLSKFSLNITEDHVMEYTSPGQVDAGTLTNLTVDFDKYTNLTIDTKGAVIAQLLVDDQVSVGGMQVPRKAGDKVVLGYVSLATFNNPAGLEAMGDNMFVVSANSGNATYTTPSNGNAGSLSPSNLEMSNVDLSEEMVNMIITQRGFQANSRIITTTDTMLEELVNLKR